MIPRLETAIEWARVVQKHMVARAQSGPRINLQAIAYREGLVWLGHCLEMDVVAEGKTPADAMRNLMDLCRFQIEVAMEAGDLESVFRPAPPEIWKMYSMGRTMESPKPQRSRAGNAVSRFEARRLEFA
jgi:predicted RNase H-like HicB family nuclease